MTVTTQEDRPPWIYRSCPGVRFAAPVPPARRARGPVRRHHGRCRSGPPGDGLRAGRGAACGIRPLYRDHHDRRWGAVRLVQAAHQRSDQRDLDRGPERHQHRSQCGREDPGRRAAGVHGGHRTARHHLDAPGGSHPLHLALGHHRFHPGRVHAAGTRPDEEPAGPGIDGWGPRHFPVSILADDDRGRGRQHGNAVDRPCIDRDGARAALAEEPPRTALVARAAPYGTDDGSRGRLARARGQRRAGRGRDPGQAADAAAPDDRLRLDS